MAWRDNRGGTLSTYGVEVATSGAMLAPRASLISSTGAAPVLGSTGTSRYVATWSEGGRRIGLDVDGKTLVALGNTDLELPSSAPPAGHPANACTPSGCLAVWTINGTDIAPDSDIEGAIVLPDGTVKPTFSIATAREPQREPAVATDGTDYVVVWVDCRDDPAPRNTQYTCTSALYGARVSASGSLLDGDASAVQITTPETRKDAGVTLTLGTMRPISRATRRRRNISWCGRTVRWTTPTSGAGVSARTRV